jgi:glycosyltransferase involved in cell wall biosynthesis
MSKFLTINLSFLLQKPTGITTYAVNLLPYLDSLNPTLLVSKNIPEYKCYPIPPNQTAEQGVKGHIRRLLWTQLQLPKIYQQLNSSLLFSPVPEAPLGAKCRSVVMVHDLIPLRFSNFSLPLTYYFRYYIPHVLEQSQHIICNSLATAQDIIKFFNLKAEKITPIPLAYDSSHFRCLNLPMQNYFLYIGRQDSYKNLHRLIAAFAALPNCREYELWLAGSTDKRYTPNIIHQVKELDLTRQVKFLDYVAYADLPKLINSAIALVFPSLWEGFGLPVLETMACGTPVITSNLSSLPEVVGDAAILVNPYNIEEITAAMNDIAHDTGLRSQMSQASLARSSQFSWEKTGLATAQLLQKYL